MFKSKPKCFTAIPLPKTLLLWACTVAMRAFYCGFWSQIRFVGCSPLTIVSFVVDYHYPIPASGWPSGGHRSPHNSACAPCSYPGACPWCHVR